jgi:hypothetical protein
VVLTIISILSAYWYSRPYIVVDSILQQGGNPMYHEFVIKNSGRTEAQNLSITVGFNNFNVDGSRFSISGGLGITGPAIIEGADMAPDQKLQFNLSKFVGVSQGSRIDASIALFFDYTDFLHIPHATVLFYQTINNRGSTEWRPIGPKLAEAARNGASSRAD